MPPNRESSGQLVEQMGQPEYAPPNLNSEGRKANPDWLLSFLIILPLLDQICK